MENHSVFELSGPALIPIGHVTLVAPRPIRESPASLYLLGLAPSSQKTMRHHLRQLATWLMPGANEESFPWWRLGYAETMMIRDGLRRVTNKRTGQPLAASSLNLKLHALRGVLRACWNLKLMAAEDYTTACTVKLLPDPHPRAGRLLPDRELVKLLEELTKWNTAMAIRDAALISCMFPGGLRGGEVAALDRADYIETNETKGLLVRHGKGNKERFVPFARANCHYLDLWVAGPWAEARTMTDSPALFFRLSNNGNLIETYAGQRLSRQTISAMVKSRAKKTGIERLTGHDLRRLTATKSIQQGNDLFTIAELLGHASISTTARYDMAIDEKKQKLAETLHLPDLTN